MPHSQEVVTYPAQLADSAGRRYLAPATLTRLEGCPELVAPPSSSIDAICLQMTKAGTAKHKVAEGCEDWSCLGCTSAPMQELMNTACSARDCCGHGKVVQRVYSGSVITRVTVCSFSTQERNVARPLHSVNHSAQGPSVAGMSTLHPPCQGEGSSWGPGPRYPPAQIQGR